MITSADNDKLKTIRKLHDRSWRDKLGLFVAEGEDLVDAAAAAGWEPEFVLRAGEDVSHELLNEVSTIGSGTRVLGVYRREPQQISRAIGRFSVGAPRLSVYLHGVGDPANVGAIVRTAHALADGPVLLGPGCADPWSPKAVRASMGSIFARPPESGDPSGNLLALDPRAETRLEEIEIDPPIVVCLGAEREGLPAEVGGERARIPIGGPESLNVAAAAAIALYELRNRMARHA
jgi:TrmH family RNA methyltransferase